MSPMGLRKGLRKGLRGTRSLPSAFKHPPGNGPGPTEVLGRAVLNQAIAWPGQSEPGPTAPGPPLVPAVYELVTSGCQWALALWALHRGRSK